MNRSRCGFGAVVCGCAAAMVVSAGDTAPDAHIRYSFTVRNTTGGLVERAALWTYAPVTNMPSQACRRLDASHPFATLTDKHGNTLLRFAFTNMAPYASIIVRIEAELEMDAEPAESAVATGAFLGAERLIEIDRQDVRAAAPTFEGIAESDRPKAIFDWVVANVKDSGYARRDRGAWHALSEKSGDCTEFAALFVALCRMQGIPSRLIGGYVVERSQVLKPGAYHNWAEFHDGRAWRIADPHRKRFGEGARGYVAMQILGDGDGPMRGAARFRVEGPGLRGRMN